MVCENLCGRTPPCLQPGFDGLAVLIRQCGMMGKQFRMTPGNVEKMFE